jgi:excisionase family DNA binding protein
MKALKSVEQAAGLLGISPWTVRGYIREGKLRPVRLGRRVLMEETELERFVEEGKRAEEVPHQDSDNSRGSDAARNTATSGERYAE